MSTALKDLKSENDKIKNIINLFSEIDENMKKYIAMKDDEKSASEFFNKSIQPSFDLIMKSDSDTYAILQYIIRYMHFLR